MRFHPIALAMRYLRGKRTLRGAPYHGRPTFSSPAAAVEVLKQFTGQDFGTSTRRWSAWLRRNGHGQYADRS